MLTSGSVQTAKGRAEVYNNRGNAYKRKGDFDHAIADYDQAISLEPKDATAYNNRGSAYSDKGDFARSIADNGEAIRLDSEYEDAYYNRGLTYLRQGNLARSIADYGEAIRLNPKDAVAYANRAEGRARKGDLQYALADSETAIRLRPRSAGMRALRAYIFGKLNQFDRAFAEIAEAFTLDEKDSEAFRFRGELHLLRGEAQAALRDFEAALGENPHGTFAQDGLDAAKRMLASSQRRPPTAVATAIPATLTLLRLAENRIALIIGNADYVAQPPLKNPQNDATAVAAALRSAGFQKVIVAANLARSELITALQDFQDEADRADWALIYFSGHGVEIGGMNYVVPTDAHLKADRNVPDEAVSLNRLIDSVGGARKLKIVILDACRENPFAAAMQRTLAFKSTNKGLAPVEPSRATLIVYAAKDGEFAQDGNGDNSPFAAALAKHLGEPHLEVSKLFRLVTDDVLEATGQQQQPFVYGSLPGKEDFYFRP